MAHIRISSVGLGVALTLAASAQTPAQPGAGSAAKPAAVTKPAEAAKPQTPAEKESARLQSISAWAKKTRATREQVQAAVFAPIIAGNQSDAEKNREAAVSIGQKADAAAKSGDAQGAKKLRTVSELFAECAKDNLRFLSSYKGGDMTGAKEALTRLRAYDERIAEVAGQRVPRSWYAHEYMVATMGMTEADATQWAKQQFLGASLPATPAAPATPAPRAQK